MVSVRFDRRQCGSGVQFMHQHAQIENVPRLCIGVAAVGTQDAALHVHAGPPCIASFAWQASYCLSEMRRRTVGGGVDPVAGM